MYKLLNLPFVLLYHFLLEKVIVDIAYNHLIMNASILNPKILFTNKKTTSFS
jgi:hypothetical protein